MPSATARALVALAAVAAAVAATAPAALAHDPLDDLDDLGGTSDYSLVTCGSVVKLAHVATSYRLHSHKVTYGNSGSGQQSVTAVSAADDPNSLWSVAATPASPCAAGAPVRNKQVVRLRHVGTRKRLHSHLHQSPLSQQQEVSGFDEKGDGGDSGDDWRIVSVGNDALWRRGAPVRLQHVDTGAFLETNSRYQYGNPIPGQLEVYAAKKRTANGQWRTEEGIYIEAH